MFEIEVPDVIGNARVIEYAVVNLSVLTGNTEHFVNGKIQGTAYGLTICQHKPGEGYYLFRCSARWIEFADTWHETIEDAKYQATYEYAGKAHKWHFK